MLRDQTESQSKSRSRVCAISISESFAPAGTPYLDDDRPLPCPAIFCFASLPIVFRPSALGDLDRDCQRLLDQAALSDANRKHEVGLKRVIATLQQGTILSREWNGRMERVAVSADGFAWNGKTYPSLSKVAFAITGTRWNGPRFFGLRDRSTPGSEANP